MNRKLIAAVAVLAALALAGVAHALFSPPPHLSAWRNGPEDLSEFRTAIEGLGYGTASIGVSPHALGTVSEPDRVLVLVAGVEREYRPGEIDRLVDFVDAGGLLIVADDFGFANALSDRFGVNFDKLRLFDENYQTNASLVTVRATLGARDYPLVLNVPTGLSVRNTDATVVAVSSEKSYLDADGDGVKDESDVQGATVVAVIVPHGEGRAAFLGDPAPFTNGMLSRGENRKFTVDLVHAMLGDGAGTVLFDESRHSRSVLGAGVALGLESLVVLTRETGLRWLALATLALAAAAWLRYRKREAALGHHAGRLDVPIRVPPNATPDRLRHLARARLASVHGVAPDAPPEEFRRVATDEVVGRLAAGDDGLNMADSLDDILQRIHQYGRSAPGRRDAP